MVAFDGAVQLHRSVIAPVRALTDLARSVGIQLSVASGFRSYDRQTMIWNAKATGRRPVFDHRGKPLDVASMPPEQAVRAILRWSALPGTSRHHWGTDMDVWDRGAVGDDYALQLVPEEYAAGGPFAALDHWLGGEQVADLGFFRPYALDRGGVAPEPWHLSYRPLAAEFSASLDADSLRPCLAAADIALKDTVLAMLDEIFDRFVICDG